MTLGIMKIWRFFAPAVLILLYGALILYFLSGKFYELPDLSKTPYLISVVVPAALYYITPFRRWVNRASQERIDENLRSGLVNIAGYEDRPDRYTWGKLKSLFFNLVDNDKSMSVKASNAYFNGLLWTMFADSIVISTVCSLVAVGLIYFDAPNAAIMLAVFICILIVSWLGHKATVIRQISIGNEQLEHMRFDHKTTIEKRLNALDK